jgi:hypothetical protein
MPEDRIQDLGEIQRAETSLPILSERRREREVAPRTRRPLEATPFTGPWGETSPILK